MTGKMTVIFYSLLLVSVFFISCKADDAGTQAPYDDAGTQAPSDEAGTQARFDELEKAETKSDAWSDRSTTTVEDQLDRLEILMGILMQDIQAVRIGQGLLENAIMSRLEDVEETLSENQPAGQADCMKCMMDTHCKNDSDAPVHKVYKDCQAAFAAGHTTSGVYRIKPDGVNETEVYCEQELSGGGWTVFQKRKDGSVDFYRGWEDYKQGFGSAAGEYWIGNDHLHSLTANKDTQLLVELESGGDTAYARYNEFWVLNEANNYKLHVGGFSNGQNNPGDSLAYHNGSPFSTWDRDNDGGSYNCAQRYSGAWWYFLCYLSNLNGLYNTSSDKGVTWRTWKGYTSLSAVRLMLKIK